MKFESGQVGNYVNGTYSNTMAITKQFLALVVASYPSNVQEALANLVVETYDAEVGKMPQTKTGKVGEAKPGKVSAEGKQTFTRQDGGNGFETESHPILALAWSEKAIGELVAKRILSWEHFDSSWLNLYITAWLEKKVQRLQDDLKFSLLEKAFLAANPGKTRADFLESLKKTSV